MVGISGASRATATAALLAALLLPGCQEEQRGRPAVSLEQARQTTSRFEGQTFTPPPRSIADVTAVLDRLKPDDSAVIEWRKVADAEPPAELLAPGQTARLASFYLRRAEAANELGRIKQSRDDIARALDLAREARIALPEFLSAKYIIESWAGNPRAALAASEERRRVTERNSRVTSVVNVGHQQLILGDLEAARDALSEARVIDVGRQESVWMASREWNLLRLESRIALSSGRYEDAIASGAAAVTIAETSLMPQERRLMASGNIPPYDFTIRRDMARTYVSAGLRELGRASEAELQMRAALESHLPVRGRYHGATVTFADGLARTILAQGRAADAERLSRANLETLERMAADRDSTLYVGVRSTLLSALALQERWDPAIIEARALTEATAGDDRLRRLHVEQNADVAAARLRAGEADAVARELAAATPVAERTYGPRHYLTAEIRGYLGVARLAVGDRTGALAAFAEATPVLLSPSRESAETTGPVRERRRREILEAHLLALAEVGGPGAAGEAFVIAEAARGGAVQLAIGDAAARAAARDPALADLARREQDSRRRIAALNALLSAAAATGEQDAAVMARLRGEIDALRDARAALRAEIERRFPDYARLVDPRPPTLDQVRATLRPGEALIATYAAPGRALVWAIPAGGAPAFAAVKLTRADLDRQVGALREALDPRAETLGDIPAFDVEAAHALHRQLLEPVAPGWRGARRLLVIAHGPLAQLPFALLVTRQAGARPERAGEALFQPYREVPFLVRDAAVVQLPSATALVGLRALPAPSADRRPFVGFADPAFRPGQQLVAAASPGAIETRGGAPRGIKLDRRSAPQTQRLDTAALAQLPPLPDSAEEVRQVARALGADPDRDVFLGAEASERRVRTMNLADRRVVMFATHGLVAGDLDGLTEPALALAAPQNADADGDGLLTMGEILALRLDADWVVLSACNTAAADGAGAEAVSGLGRAFFYAGSRALLVSHWPVETTSARALTTDLFRRQAVDPGLERAEALQRAMLAMIDGPGALDAQGRTVFSYAHPIFWAPFALVGDGGGQRPGG